MKAKRILSMALVLCMLLSVLPAVSFAADESNTASTAVAAVRYLDAGGAERFTVEYQFLDADTTTISDGWYVVRGSVSIAGILTVKGAVHLILCDRSSLTAAGVQVQSADSLTIYAQSTNPEVMGKLDSEAETQGQAGIGGFKGTNGSIVINGGMITATGQITFSAGIGGGSHSQYIPRYICGPITINGGIVKAYGGKQAAGIGGGFKGQGGDVTVNGGVVTATGGNNGSGIGGGREAPGGNYVQNGGIVIVPRGRSDLSPGCISIGYGSAGGSAGKTAFHGGITFQAGAGKINGSSYTLNESFTIPGDETITVNGIYTIPGDATLTVESGKTLTVAEDGYLCVSGSLVNKGTIVNDGGILNEGNFTNNGTVSCGVYAKKHPVTDGATSCEFCGSSAEAPRYSDGKYYVSENEHMYWIAEQINSGKITEKLNIVLVDDVEIGGTNRPWTPILLPDAQGCFFEGNGHTITFSQDYTEVENAPNTIGLFSSANYSVFRNLVLKGGIVCNTTADVGIMAGTAYRTTFENIVSYADVLNYAESGNVGGLVGYYGGKHDSGAGLYSKIVNCAVYANVQGYNAGGLIGKGWNGTQYFDITNSVYVGEVTANGNTGGAIVGYQATDSNTCTFTNVFWKEQNGLDFYGKRDTTNQVYNNTSAKTAEEFASGELAWILNDGVADGTQVWRQELGYDAVPVQSGLSVFHGYTHRCIDTEPIYSNVYGYLGETIADHSYISDCDIACDFCNAARTGLADHTFQYQSNADGHWQVCTVCGEETSSSDHSMRYEDNHNYTHSYICEFCRYETIWENHYVYYVDNGDGTHDRACAQCDFSHKETNPHIIVKIDNGDGTHTIKCSKCPYVLSDQNVHTMIYKDQGDGTHVYCCTECTYSEEAQAHRLAGKDNGDGTHTESCPDCGLAGEPVEHSIVDGICKSCTYIQLIEPQQKNGVYQIGSPSELYWFSQYVNSGNVEANAVLTADIVVNSDISATYLSEWSPIGSSDYYTGTFDGQGHTVSGLYMNGEYDVMGLVGQNDGIVRNVGVVNSIFASTKNSCNAGGVVGGNYVTVSGCWFDGEITTTGSDCYTGGVVGYNGKSVQNCYNLGKVTNGYNGAYGGITTVGGVVGHNMGGTVKNCYNAGTVNNDVGNSQSRVGLIVGCNFGYDYSSMGMGVGYATVLNCYSAYGDLDVIGYSGTKNSSESDVFCVEDETLASGELAYMLNSYSESGVWGQTIGEDAHPVIGGATVYEVYACDNSRLYSNENKNQNHIYGDDGVCDVCGNVEGTDPVVDNNITFGAQLYLENDLTMAFRVKEDKLAAYEPSTAYLVVERDVYESGAKEAFVETMTIREYTIENGRLIFSYPGIAAAQMNDAIRATLYIKDANGKEYVSPVLNTSVATYLNGLLSASASDTKLITLLMDMVNYGAAAQVYFDRHADAPVNEAFDSFKTYASYASADFKTALENLSTTENAEGKSGKLNLGLDLGTRIGIQYKVTVPTDVNVEDVTLVVTDASGNVLETLAVAGNETDSRGRYLVNFYGFTSRDMRRVVYATAYANGEAITGTYAYSISTYAWGVQENAGLQPENLVNVTRAMMLYGDSAAAYFA